jgi:hypothetical protein
MFESKIKSGKLPKWMELAHRDCTRQNINTNSHKKGTDWCTVLGKVDSALIRRKYTVHDNKS